MNTREGKTSENEKNKGKVSMFEELINLQYFFRRHLTTQVKGYKI